MFNAYPYMMPAAGAAAIEGTKGLSFLGKIKWSQVLSNASKALNLANQAIPLYYQVKPVFQNIKTLTKIGKEFTNSSKISSTKVANTKTSDNINNIITKQKDSDIPEVNYFI